MADDRSLAVTFPVFFDWRRHFLEDRQVNDEFAPLAAPAAGDSDAATMHIHEAPNEREANSQAALRLVEQMLILDVRLKNSRKDLRRNPGAVVAYPNESFFALPLDRQPNLAPFVR